ncbi:ABC transporter substrate-binding protein [Lysinimonas soli]|uniref:ABC transporter substrate-binding protein n=1 Tax=Lysinimonas soli TaxID=1074233 RepID=A0ABW0NRB1_9MICO
MIVLARARLTPQIVTQSGVPSMKHSISLRSKLAGAVALATTTALLLAGCSSSGGDGGSTASADPYIVGFANAATGPTASVTLAYQEAAQLAIDTINAAGGIKGTKLKLAAEDDLGTADGAVAAINKLINVDNAPFTLINASAPTSAAQPLAAQAGTVLLSLGATSNTLLNKDNLWINGVNIVRLVPALADKLWSQGHRKIAFIGSADPFGQGALSVLKPYWTKLGGTIVAEQTFNSATDTDFSSQLLQIKAAKPDLVFAVGIGDVLGNVVKQARAAGITVPMAGPLATDGLLHVAGADAEGFEDVGPAVNNDLKTASFTTLKTDWAKASKLTLDWQPVTAYEGVYLYADLIKQALAAGKDPRDGTVLNSLIKKASFEDLMQGGTVKFAADHSVLRQIALRTVTDGKFVISSTVTPKE